MSVYEEWLAISANLKLMKSAELELRNSICKEFLIDKLEGAATCYKEGLSITATAKLTRSIDREVLEAIWGDLTDEEKECIDYKPSLKLAKYKTLEHDGCLLMDAITIKPAQASLKITERDV